MNSIFFEQHLILRNRVLDNINPLSNNQLHKIPANFKNNIIWNAAHIIATQQILVYKLSNTPYTVDEFWVENFKKGTVANTVLDESKISDLKTLLISSSTQMKKDYNNGVFNEYNSYTTSFGVQLNSIEEAIQFNSLHESLHLGYIMAQKHLF